MPTLHADQFHPTSVEDILHKRGFTHLRARKYGAAVIVESGPKSNPIRHFRIRRDTVHLWLLDFSLHNDRWEKTPFRAPLRDLVEAVIEQFPWTIAFIEDNPERT